MLAYTAVIPAFNAERTIEECLASVLAQTCLPAEILVVDDGSSDRTAAMVTTLAAAAPRVPIRLLQQANQGPGHATTAGILAATEPVIATLDADDLWLPGKQDGAATVGTGSPARGRPGGRLVAPVPPRQTRRRRG